MNETTLLESIRVLIEAQTAELKGEIAGIKGEIAGIKGEIAGIKGEIAGIKGEIAGIKGEMSDMKENLKRIEDKMDAGFAATRSELVDAIETVGNKVESLEGSVKEVETVTARNAFDVQLIKARA